MAIPNISKTARVLIFVTGPGLLTLFVSLVSRALMLDLLYGFPCDTLFLIGSITSLAGIAGMMVFQIVLQRRKEVNESGTDGNS